MYHSENLIINRNIGDNTANNTVIDRSQIMALLFGMISASSVTMALTGFVIGAINELDHVNEQLLLKNVMERLEIVEKNLKDSIIFDKDKSEKCINLVHYGLIKSRICHRNEQLYCIADIILDSVEKELINEDDSEILIDIVSYMDYKEGIRRFASFS